MGGMAKITVAIMAGTWPKPNKTTIGTRYAICGVACIKSNIGVITAAARFDRVTQIPSNRPMIAANGTDTSTIDKVRMESLHKPKIARYNMQAALNSAKRQPPTQ